MLNKKDLELLTVAQLKEYAKELGITKKLTLKSDFMFDAKLVSTSTSRMLNHKRSLNLMNYNAVLMVITHNALEPKPYRKKIFTAGR